jgi:EAL domain-containing protein (putative c-di-GMP-specific phosphodiesterase class I)
VSRPGRAAPPGHGPGAPGIVNAAFARFLAPGFGTGYSSLNYLRRFPFDKIKIDRSFVRDLCGDDNLSAVIVEAVVRLARAPDVTTTAEGVETTQQLDIIRAAGVTQMQGWLYSPARPSEEIDALFASEAARKVTAA